MSATRTTRLHRPWTSAQPAPVCSAGCVPGGEGTDMIRSSEPPPPPCPAPAARSPPRASHQAVPAHGGHSGEAADNYLMQIADGHFISIHAEAPLTWCGVAFVPLQRGMAGLFWSFSASPRARSGEVLSKVSYIKVENIKLRPPWDRGLKRKLENRISAS